MITTQADRAEALESVTIARMLTDMLEDVVLPTRATCVLGALKLAVERSDSAGIGS